MIKTPLSVLAVWWMSRWKRFLLHFNQQDRYLMFQGNSIAAPPRHYLKSCCAHTTFIYSRLSYFMCCCCCCSKQLPAAGGHSNGFHITLGRQRRERKEKKKPNETESQKILIINFSTKKYRKGALLEDELLFGIEPATWHPLTTLAHPLWIVLSSIPTFI